MERNTSVSSLVGEEIGMMTKRSLVCLLACALAHMVGLWASVSAQGDLATVTGRVLDPNAAVIVEATVTARNVDTGIETVVRTNEDGIYRFVNLGPGNYEISVSKKGFKLTVKPGVTLHVADTVSMNFSMQVGTVSETVTVEGGAPLINTESAAVSTVVDRKFVENTPLNGRSFQDLISMTPGVVTQNPNTSPSGAGSGGDFSVNGQRTEANIYMVDGVSANVAAGSGRGTFSGQRAASGSVPAGTALGTTQSLVSVDALQEFRVQSSTYSAEFGRGPGGQFSLVTRTGTNDFHGSVFEYFRNNFFDANDWFNNSLGKPISPLRQNDFGGTLGGPILIPHLYHGKDKTFFFVSYEGLRLIQPQAASTSQLVPDTFMRQQAPAALQPILNAYPVQSLNGKDFGTAATPSLAQFIEPFSLPSQFDSTSIRLDHTFGPKLSLFFRVGYTPSSKSSRTLSVLSRNTSNIQTYTLGGISQLSSKASNDLRLGYTRSDAEFVGTLDSFAGATPIDLAAAMGAGSSAGSLLQMQIVVPGAGSATLSRTIANNRLRQWNFIDTFSIAFGRHHFKVGADYRRIVSPNNPVSPQIVGAYFGAQQVLSNKPFALAVLNSVGATPIFNETAVFFQDEWHLTPRLNLSLGLRWEADPAPHGANGQDAYTLLGSISNPSSLTLAPRGTPLWNTSWYNLAPRLGLAWAAHNNPGWETVVRAGGGVFFDTDNQVAMEPFSAIGFSATATYFGAPLPVTPAQLNLTPSVSPPFNSSVHLFPAHLQLPYTLEWNVAVQQAIGAKQAITLTYVASAGRRGSGQQQLSVQNFNPNFTSNSKVAYWTSALTSDYEALQAQFQRSVSHGIHALASYTWSHCLDTGSSYSSLPTALGIGQTAFIRGNCDFDVRHNFQGGGSWDLPGVSGNGLAKALANHWGLDGRLIARTGFPVPICGTQLTDPATGSQYCPGLNVVANQPIYVYGSQYPGGRAINPAAFINPAAGQLGSAPRNFVRGFSDWQINMAVRREFPISERLRLQFRAEAFNLLNHPNFGRVDPTRSSATFGRATQMLNQNISTLASQYQQGGPRSMQFALKFLF